MQEGLHLCLRGASHLVAGEMSILPPTRKYHGFHQNGTLNEYCRRPPPPHFRDDDDPVITFNVNLFHETQWS